MRQTRQVGWGAAGQMGGGGRAGEQQMHRAGVGQGGGAGRLQVGPGDCTGSLQGGFKQQGGCREHQVGGGKSLQGNHRQVSGRLQGGCQGVADSGAGRKVQGCMEERRGAATTTTPGVGLLTVGAWVLDDVCWVLGVVSWVVADMV